MPSPTFPNTLTGEARQQELKDAAIACVSTPHGDDHKSDACPLARVLPVGIGYHQPTLDAVGVIVNSSTIATATTAQHLSGTFKALLRRWAVRHLLTPAPRQQVAA